MKKMKEKFNFKGLLRLMKIGKQRSKVIWPIKQNIMALDISLNCLRKKLETLTCLVVRERPIEHSRGRERESREGE